MTDMKVTIVKEGNKYVAGLFSSKGLYATSLPRNSVDDAIKDVEGFGFEEDRNSENINTLKLVFDLFSGIEIQKAKNVVLDFSDLTEKQIAVLKVTRQIPYGRTLTYGQVAERAGLPGAARFVGNVMAGNRFAPFIPCHRVVSTTGLGGYTGGLDIKRELLSKEGAFAD